MLSMLTALLVVLWLFEAFAGYPVGAWAHVLLVLALATVAIGLLRRGTGSI